MFSSTYEENSCQYLINTGIPPHQSIFQFSSFHRIAAFEYSLFKMAPFRILNLFAILAATTAFAPMPSNTASSTRLYEGQIEQIEFKIYPDGRIEEKVIGVKGGECHKITEEINKNLGKVVDSKPTEEMYEQKIQIDQTVEVSNDNGWEGSSSW